MCTDDIGDPPPLGKHMLYLLALTQDALPILDPI